MNDLISLQGPYKALGWETSKRDAVLTDFIDVIRNNIIAGFGVGVDSKYLRSIPKEFQKLIGDPQMLCFQRILRIVVNTLHRVGYQSTITVTFDDCEEYSVRCYRMWSRLRQLSPELGELIPSISFADDCKFFPLQAADLLSWETNKHLRQMAGKYKTRLTMERLMQSTTPGYGLEYISELWDDENIDRLCRDIASGKIKTLDKI
jgi:hypothetical protein